MQIISVVAFGNGREAYPSQHKSQVRCQWDNLTWKILLCPRTCVSALQVSCSPVLTGCACLLLPSCFHLDFKYGFTTYFHLSLAWLLWLLSRGKDERGSVSDSPRSRLVLPHFFAFAGCGHMRALRLWAQVCVSPCRHSVLAVTYSL